MDDDNIVEEILDDPELELGIGLKAVRWSLSGLAGLAASQLTEHAFDSAVRFVRARKS